MKVAIDFDGTLVKHSKFPTFKYEFMPYAKEAIMNLHKNGVEMILNTGRYTWYRFPAFWFIWKNKLPIKITLFNKKPQTDLLIDDCNIFCKKIDWKKIEKEVLRLQKEVK